MQSSEEPSAARQLQKTLEKASSLAMPEGRDKKTLRRLKKKLNAQRQLVEKQSRSEESSAETKRHMLRQNDKAFIAEIRRFLGEEDEDVRQLLRHDGGRAPGNTGQEERPMKKQKSVSRAGDKVELCGRKRRRESAETLSVTRADEEGDRHESSYGGCKAAKRGRREVSHTENHHHTAAGAARTCGRDTREAVNGSSSEQPTLKKKKKKRASREMGSTSSH
ncbi:hypothetical protein TcCL_NonESM06985 [Trypanosoma cruzi]|nr:hypothetical protein TcCL_NonESM06985 [Trypanosoma cruzi]